MYARRVGALFASGVHQLYSVRFLSKQRVLPRPHTHGRRKLEVRAVSSLPDGGQLAEGDYVDGFVASQEALKNLQVTGVPIGEVVNPRFANMEFADKVDEAIRDLEFSAVRRSLGRSDDRLADSGEPGSPSESDDTWRTRTEKLHKRFEELHGYKLVSAMKTLEDVAQFAQATTLHCWETGWVLVVTDASGERHEFDVRERLDVKALECHCSPSPYGDLTTMTTRYDPSVRSALELRHKDVADGPGEAYFTLEARPRRLSASSDKPTTHVQLEQAVASESAWIAAGVAGRSVRAVPQKLNIYGPGDHFKRHVDTPVGDRPAMLGTALVALNSHFKGGKLVVDAPGAPGQRTAVAPPGSSLSTSLVWAPSDSWGTPMVTFFGDCPHEVTPVTSGHRITLSFALYSDRNVGAPSDTSSGAHALQEARDQTLRKAAEAVVLQIQESLKAGKPFGLILVHGYTQSSLEGEGHLKGADAALWSALQSAELGGATVHLRPVVYQHHEYESGSADEPEKYKYDFSCCVYSFTSSEVKLLREGKPAPHAAVKVVESAGNVSSDAEVSLRDISFFKVATPRICLQQSHQRAIEHTGNESQPGVDDQTYFSGAIIILPPRSSP